MSSEKTTILVTGGAGYIGAHAVLALQRSGYEVIVLDNLVYGHRDIVEKILQVELVIGDTNDRQLLDQLFATTKLKPLCILPPMLTWVSLWSLLLNTTVIMLSAP